MNALRQRRYVVNEYIKTHFPSFAECATSKMSITHITSLSQLNGILAKSDDKLSVSGIRAELTVS